MELEELICELVKESVSHNDKAIEKCIEKLLNSNLSGECKKKIAKYKKKEKKSIRIVTDFDQRTDSKIVKEDFEVKCGNHVSVYTMTDMRDLIQFVGYCKYTNAENYDVYMRGQPSIYGGKMIPSLYRGKSNYASADLSFQKRLKEAIKKVGILSEYDKRIVDANSGQTVRLF